MSKVLTFGVFDYFHLGHLRLFKNCKKYGNYLIVAVQDGDFILNRKPNAKVLYSTKERIEIIESLSCVNEVIEYKNVEDDIKNIDFDILITGPDQTHDGIQKAIQWCKDNNKKHYVIDRTNGISSSSIKSTLKK